MKSLFYLSVLAFAQSALADQSEKDENFFQGLEQGFFLRNDLDGYKQFECPELHVNTDAQNQFSKLMGPAEMVLNMQNNKQLTQFWDSIMLFANNVMTFTSIGQNYDASDFC